MEKTEMHYIKVLWLHGRPDDPIMLYSECDDDGWEIRKVEVFPDGSFVSTDEEYNGHGTGLGLEPIPSLDEISKSPNFQPSKIEKADFEKVWSKAKKNVSQRPRL